MRYLFKDYTCELRQSPLQAAQSHISTPQSPLLKNKGTMLGWLRASPANSNTIRYRSNTTCPRNGQEKWPLVLPKRCGQWTLEPNYKIENWHGCFWGPIYKTNTSNGQRTKDWRCQTSWLHIYCWWQNPAPYKKLSMSTGAGFYSIKSITNLSFYTWHSIWRIVWHPIWYLNSHRVESWHFALYFQFSITSAGFLLKIYFPLVKIAWRSWYKTSQILFWHLTCYIIHHNSGAIVSQKLLHLGPYFWNAFLPRGFKIVAHQISTTNLYQKKTYFYRRKNKLGTRWRIFGRSFSFSKWWFCAGR